MMKIQLLSDLHLETESFEPEPAPAADVLVLAGDIDSTWRGYERFAGWPVPVLVVAGNHEFDGREWRHAWPAFARLCERLGFELLEKRSLVLRSAAGQAVRFVGSTRWSDFDVFGPLQRERAQKAAKHFLRLMATQIDGQPFGVAEVREEALRCRAWLAQELALSGDWQHSVAITHFAPSLKSADPRFGAQPGTASFCNADDDLLPAVPLWLHGHLHCRHDYRVAHADGRSTRVVCHARGLAHKGESEAYAATGLLIDVGAAAGKLESNALRINEGDRR